MVTALLVMTLAADPSAAVVLARKTAVKDGEGLALAEKVAARLGVSNLMPFADSQKRLAALGLKDATNCNGNAECHAEIAKLLKVDWLVLVSVSQIAADQSVALELFRVSKQDVVERESLLLEKRGDVPAAQLEAFGAKMQGRLAAGPRADAPMKDVEPAKNPVTDPNVSVKDPLVPVAPEPRSHAATFVVGGLGLAALGAGVGLLVHGLTQRAPLQGVAGADGVVRSELTGSAAQALNDRTSVEFGLAGAAGAVGLGLLATSIALW